MELAVFNVSHYKPVMKSLHTPCVKEPLSGAVFNSQIQTPGAQILHHQKNDLGVPYYVPPRGFAPRFLGTSPSPISSTPDIFALIDAQNVPGVQKSLSENWGATLQIFDSAGLAPLHRAVLNGNRDVITTMIEKGYPLTTLDLSGNSILHLALSQKGSQSFETVYKVLAGFKHKEVSETWTENQKNTFNKQLKLVLNGVNSSHKSPLAVTFELNQLDRMEKLLKLGVQPKMGSAGSEPPLHQAIARNNMEMVRLLLAYQADPNEVSKNEQPLSFAIKTNNFALAKTLVEKGANVQAALVKNELTPLMYATQLGFIPLMEYFVKSGADVEAKAADNTNALAIAIQRNSVDLVDTLLKLGASPDGLFNSQQTPLQAALKQGNIRIAVRLLKSGADPNLYAANHRILPLSMAISSMNVDLVSAFLKAGADPNLRGPEKGMMLGLALEKGRIDIFQKLLEAGADPNQQPLLHNQHTVLCQAIQQKQPEFLSKLLLAGADPNTISAFGETPLIKAMGLESPLRETMAKRLLASGANPNIISQWSVAPLSLAIMKGAEEVATLLIDAGADLNLKQGSSENTPLHHLVEESASDKQARLDAMVKGKPKNSGKIKPVSPPPPPPPSATSLGYEFLEKMLVLGADPQLKNKQNQTPMDIARLECLLAMQSSLADDFSPQRRQLSQFQAAVSTGNLTRVKSLFKWAETEEARKRLLNQANPMGETSLHLAAQSKNASIVEFLLKAGADPWKKDFMDALPFHHAVESKNYYSVKHFIDAQPELKTLSYPEKSKNPIVWAFENNVPYTLEALLDAKFPVEDTVNLSKVVERDSVSLLQSFLAAGADPNQQDMNQQTALLAATEKGSLEMVQALLAKGANPNLSGLLGRTPLHWAIRSKKPSAVMIAEALVKAGANPLQKDELGKTPLALAEQFDQVALISLLKNALNPSGVSS
jgi:ankyrin repeat protein